MSITAIPMFSKFGLGRASSHPAVPSSNANHLSSPTTRTARSPLGTSTVTPTDDASGREDAQRTGIDRDEHLTMDEPDSFEYVDDHDAQGTALGYQDKRNLKLDIHASASTPPSSFRQDRDSPSAMFSERINGEEDVLKELGENHVKRGRGYPPQSPSACTNGVWICSKPQSSNPSSPIDEDKTRRRSVGRPLVVRSMSTGRLAHEFDEEGRVVSLSTHCERVLKGRLMASPPSPLHEGDELRRTISAATPMTPPRHGISRAQTASNVALPLPNRRRSEAGFKKVESFGSWNKRAVGAGDARM